MAKDIHILIRDLPTEVDETLDMLAILSGKRKWEVQRMALIEYANNHKGEVEELASKKARSRNVKVV